MPPPPPKYVAYSGDGHGLGGAAQGTGLGVNTAAAEKPTVSTARACKHALTRIHEQVKEGDETTKIQFRFHNG